MSEYNKCYLYVLATRKISNEIKKDVVVFLHVFRCTPHSSPSQTPVRRARSGSRSGGGWGRNPDVLMEIQLSKVSYKPDMTYGK